VSIFYADKLTVMGNPKNSYVFNFAILLKSRKSDAHKIYVFYSTGCTLSRPWSRQLNDVMFEIECTQLHNELFR